MLVTFRLIISTTILLSFPTAYSAEDKSESESLPEPLTLELALNLIDQKHPDLRYSNADLKYSRSSLQQVLSSNNLSINLKSTARLIQPSTLAINQDQDDHRVGLFLNKTLYDFGRRSSQIASASQQILSNDLSYLNMRQLNHINVMRRYFDVVLSDLQFYRYNEEMAVAYIQFDRIKIRKELGQNTELDVAEKEVEYQRIRRFRVYSQNQQRITRSLLAQALNKPNSLPTTVARPNIDDLSRKLPEIDQVQKIVREKNLVLRALRAKLISAKSKVQFAQASFNPVLIGEVEAFYYSGERRSSDQWRAQVTLDIPLWSGARVDAAVAKARAVVYRIEAELTQQEFLVQQQVLELLLGIETLKIKYIEDVTGMDFIELSLDQSRALYELEVKSDLGYAMVKFSEAERQMVKTSFDIALAWAQLDALSGTLLNKKHKL